MKRRVRPNRADGNLAVIADLKKRGGRRAMNWG